MQKENADLILTGLQSDDHGFGQTGVLLAALLDLPHATIIMAIEVAGQKDALKRELEAGWFQHIECPLPAVLSIQSGINKVRYATLKGHHGREEKRNCHHHARIAGRYSPNRRRQIEKIYVPTKDEENRIPDRHAQRSSYQAGREIEVRSAGHLVLRSRIEPIMKILVITEQRQGKWNNTSFETLVAAQQIAADTGSTDQRAW